MNTLSFGPALVKDSAIVDGIDSVEVDTNFGNHSIQGNQPRTGVGVLGTPTTWFSLWSMAVPPTTRAA